MTIWVISAPLLVDPIMPLFYGFDDVRLMLLQGYKPEYDYLYDLYPSCTRLTEKTRANIKETDTIISNHHINSKVIKMKNMIRQAQESDARWVHMTHDYMDRAVITVNGVDKLIVFNNFQFTHSSFDEDSIMIINPHKSLLRQPDKKEVSIIYEHNTGRSFSDRERSRNILFNITTLSGRDLVLYPKVVKTIKHLTERGYRVFMKSYGFKTPNELLPLLTMKNVYHPVNEMNGPKGAPYAQSMCSYVLGTECSALVEGLSYGNLPIFITDVKKKETLRHFNWYFFGNIFFPMPNLHQFNLLKDKKERMKAVSMLQRMWLPAYNPTVKEIKKFIYE